VDYERVPARLWRDLVMLAEEEARRTEAAARGEEQPRYFGEPPAVFRRSG